jgi:hypothetical protein
LSLAEDFIAVDTTPRTFRASRAAENTPPEASRTPSTQKRRIDFKSLHNYGFQGPPSTSPKPSPLAKKARVNGPKKNQNHVKESSQATSIMEEDIQEEEVEQEEIERKKSNGIGKRA